jgi:hypothetical protein
VLADRYLRPAAAANGAQLQLWLATYGDHPDAAALHELLGCYHRVHTVDDAMAAARRLQRRLAWKALVLCMAFSLSKCAFVLGGPLRLCRLLDPPPLRLRRARAGGGADDALVWTFEATRGAVES